MFIKSLVHRHLDNVLFWVMFGLTVALCALVGFLIVLVVIFITKLL